MQCMRAYITIAAFAATTLLAACSPEAPAQEPNGASSSETGVSAAMDRQKHDPAPPGCPEHNLAAPTSSSLEILTHDIRTIVTGVKSPAQQEALAQAARLAPGHMNDALRTMLVDAAAFVNYLQVRNARSERADARLDSFSRLLLCALQPHFSQEELTADILSINARDEQGHFLLDNQARPETAAWLAMHIPPEEMEEKLQQAAMKGIANISNEWYPMYTTRTFLLETLIHQTPGGLDTLAANLEGTLRPGILDDHEMGALKRFVQQELHFRSQPPYIPSPLPEPETTSFSQDELLAAIQAIPKGHMEERQRQAVEQVQNMAATDPTQIGDTLRKAVLEAYFHMYMEKPSPYAPGVNAWYELRYALRRTMVTVGNAETVKRFVELEAYETECGVSDSEYLFKKFPDQSIPWIIESISRPEIQPKKKTDALEMLTAIVIDYKQGLLDMSHDSRNLLIDMTRRFLEEDGTGIWLAVVLDDPGLIAFLEDLATNPNKVAALGIPQEDIQRMQEYINSSLNQRPFMGYSDC